MYKAHDSCYMNCRVSNIKAWLEILGGLGRKQERSFYNAMADLWRDSGRSISFE
jgi:hypothetical protein